MDKKEDQTQLLDAGLEFLTTLQNLGLDPEGCFWATDTQVNEFVLVLVTSAFDVVGPLAIAEKIVAAYRASALPAIIDPFRVRLHSPRHKVMKAFLASQISIEIAANAKPYVDIQVAGVPYVFESTWLYKFDPPKTGRPSEILRRWRHFANNVDKIAA